MSSTPIDNVLSRLEKVRQRQAGQWSARCPAHADKGPSLSVRETTEGAVLVHCFAGCTVVEITGAMGLGMDELFPPKERTGREPKRLARTISPSQAVEVLATEATFVAVVCSDVIKGAPLARETYQRLLQAAARILEVTDLAKALR